jgi:hypothetical protein
MGWYIVAISFGSSFGPLFGGYIIECMLGQPPSIIQVTC